MSSPRRSGRRLHVVSVVGARPQFIKLAPVHSALTQQTRHTIIHTGQHFDAAMSGRFFAELNLPRPDINLGVRGGRHAGPTGRMLIRLEAAFDELQPDWVLVYGDTTSTLAGALAAAQAGVPLAHVEAGLRSYQKHQPEERNRVIADHLADVLFCPSARAAANLRAERIRRGIVTTGDPMHEALAAYWPEARKRPLATSSDPYYFCTLHRAENTDNPDRLRKFVRLLARLEHTVVFPLHPRTRLALERHRLWKQLSGMKHLELHEPFGYLDTLRHIHSARAVLTDSGGVQREAAWLGTRCLTLRPVTEWTETVERGVNFIVDLEYTRVVKALSRRTQSRVRVRSRGASRRIVQHLTATRGSHGLRL